MIYEETLGLVWFGWLDWLVGGRSGEYAMSQKQDSLTPVEKTRNRGEEETEGKELGLGES